MRRCRKAQRPAKDRHRDSLETNAANRVRIKRKNVRSPTAWPCSFTGAARMTFQTVILNAK